MSLARDGRVDVPLTDFAIAIRPSGYIAEVVSPRVRVAKTSGQYVIFGTEPMKQIKTLRAPKSQPNYRQRSMSHDHFNCDGHSMAETIDDKDRETVGPSLETSTVRGLVDTMAIGLEIEVATLFCTYTNYASTDFYTTIPEGDRFDVDGGGGDIRKMLSDASNTILKGCGNPSNTVIIPFKLAGVLARHHQIVDLQKAVKNQVTDSELPPFIFGHRVIIASAQKDGAREGQTKSLEPIWGDYMIPFYLNPAVDYGSMAFAKTFTLSPTGQLGNGVSFVQRRSRPEFLYNAEDIEVVEEGRDPKIVGSSAGFLFINCLNTD